MMPFLVAAALVAQQGFDAISAAGTGSAEIDATNPLLVALNREKAGTCPMSPAQIDAAITILKRARPEPKGDGGITSDLVIRFKPVDGGKPIVAVIGVQREELGGGGRIFFAGQQALLDAEGHAAIRRVSTEAGCVP